MIRILLILLPVTVHAVNWSITDDLMYWHRLDNSPRIVTGIPYYPEPDTYMEFGAGDGPIVYDKCDCRDEHEGSIVVWIRESYNTTDTINPGYPVYGPRWGVINNEGDTLYIGQNRADHQKGCMGHSIWSSARPDTAVLIGGHMPWGEELGFFYDTWVPWVLTVDSNRITVALMHPDSVEYSPYSVVTEHVLQPRSHGGLFDSLFGCGWKSFFIKGDDRGGIETMDLFVSHGTGIFNAVSNYNYDGLTGNPSIITAPAAVSVVVGDTFTYKMSGYCITGGWFALVAGPPEMSIDSYGSNPALTWNPGWNDAGRHCVQVYFAGVEQAFWVTVDGSSGLYDIPEYARTSLSNGSVLYGITGSMIQGNKSGIYLQYGPDGVLRERMVLE